MNAYHYLAILSFLTRRAADADVATRVFGVVWDDHVAAGEPQDKPGVVVAGVDCENLTSVVAARGVLPQGASRAVVPLRAASVFLARAAPMALVAAPWVPNLGAALSAAPTWTLAPMVPAAWSPLASRWSLCLDRMTWATVWTAVSAGAHEGWVRVASRWTADLALSGVAVATHANLLWVTLLLVVVASFGVVGTARGRATLVADRAASRIARERAAAATHLAVAYLRARGNVLARRAGERAHLIEGLYRLVDSLAEEATERTKQCRTLEGDVSVLTRRVEAAEVDRTTQEERSDNIHKLLAVLVEEWDHGGDAAVAAPGKPDADDDDDTAEGDTETDDGEEGDADSEGSYVAYEHASA